MSRLARALILIVMCAPLSCRIQEPLNEIPMYGGLPKSQAQRDADQRYIDEAVRIAGSREKAAQRSLRDGWQAMSKQDAGLALRRFNQAWLLLPDNADVFWAFGAACGLKGDYEDSIRYFKEAVALDSVNPSLLADFAYTYIRRGQGWFQSHLGRTGDFDSAIELLKRADSLHPDTDIVYYNWAVALFSKGDYAGSWEKVFEAEKRGGHSIEPAFLKDLGSRMHRPKPDKSGDRV